MEKLIKFFKKVKAQETVQQGRYMSDEERFIMSHNPKSIAEVEYLGQLYSKRPRAKTFGGIY